MNPDVITGAVVLQKAQDPLTPAEEETVKSVTATEFMTKPFLELPAEIRLMIYEYIAVSNLGIATDFTRRGHKNIIVTCRQINIEATAILLRQVGLGIRIYGGRFAIPRLEDPHDALRHSMKMRLWKYASAMRHTHHLCLETPVPDPRANPLSTRYGWGSARAIWVMRQRFRRAFPSLKTVTFISHVTHRTFTADWLLAVDLSLSIFSSWATLEAMYIVNRYHKQTKKMKVEPGKWHHEIEGWKILPLERAVDTDNTHLLPYVNDKTLSILAMEKLDAYSSKTLAKTRKFQ